jgi:tRNA-2-methylthio-N6-dimethylallyladenosine synthase
MSKKEYICKTVFIRTLGCQMNIRDSEVIGGLLKKTGFSLVDTPDDADVVIFNTCSVRQHAEDKVWSEIGRIAKSGRKIASSSPAASPRNDDSTRRPIIGLVGCMAQNYKSDVFRKSPYVDFVVGPADIGKIPEILEKVTRTQGHKDTKSQGHRVTGKGLFERKVWETDGLVRPEGIYHTGYRAAKEHAYVVISEGCSNYCSYCVVPYTRGELRHRPDTEILREIEEATAQGILKITLLGQNVNAYESSSDGIGLGIASAPAGSRNDVHNKATFIHLLEMIHEIKGLEEFSFITSHPKDTTPELFKEMARLDKLKKFLHLPVQSGSDRILKAMNRGYESKYYYELVGKYRTIVSGGTLTTDIIVGFPGETETDFRKTYELVERVRFDAAFIFKYSPRPGTASSRMPDDVPQKEKERRHALVLDLQKKISKSKR